MLANWIVDGTQYAFQKNWLYRQSRTEWVGERSLMTSLVFWPFLTYLPCLTLKRPFFGAILDPPTHPNMGRH